MALVNAQFLINDNTNTEQFVVNLPSSYEYGPGERLVTRAISQELYDKYIADKEDHIKLFRYVSNLTGYDLALPPKGIDYKIGLNGRLHHKPTFSENGFLIKMEFFASAIYDTNIGGYNYSDKVLESNFNYTIDPVTGFVVHRTKTITWYKEDGTAHPDTKIMHKIYNPVEMDDEAIQRRKNVIAILKVEIAMFMASILKAQYPDPKTRPDSNQMAKDLIAPINVHVLNYINGADLTLRNAVLHSPNTFWDTYMPKYNKTARNFVADRLIVL